MDICSEKKPTPFPRQSRHVSGSFRKKQETKTKQNKERTTHALILTRLPYSPPENERFVKCKRLLHSAPVRMWSVISTPGLRTICFTFSWKIVRAVICRCFRNNFNQIPSQKHYFVKCCVTFQKRFVIYIPRKWSIWMSNFQIFFFLPMENTK